VSNLAPVIDKVAPPMKEESTATAAAVGRATSISIGLAELSPLK